MARVPAAKLIEATRLMSWLLAELTNPEGTNVDVDQFITTMQQLQMAAPRPVWHGIPMELAEAVPAQLSPLIVDPELLISPLQLFKLPSRVINQCRRIGVITLEQLMLMGRTNVSQIYHVGPGAFKSLEAELLSNYGIVLPQLEMVDVLPTAWFTFMFNPRAHFTILKGQVPLAPPLWLATDERERNIAVTLREEQGIIAIRQLAELDPAELQDQFWGDGSPQVAESIQTMLARVEGI